MCFFGLLAAQVEARVQPLEMVVTEHFPPYQMADNSTMNGVAYDIVDGLLKSQNIQIEHTVLPWSRAYHIATHQKNVLIYSLRKTTKRADLFEWIGPLFHPESTLRSHSSIILWQHKDAVQPIDNEEMMRHLTLVVARGDYLMDEVVERYRWPKSNVMEVRDWTEAIDVLIDKRVQAIVLQRNNMIALSNRLGFSVDRFVPSMDLGSPPQLYIALSKDSDPELVKQLQLALQAFYNSKEYQQIEKKWAAEFTLQKN